MSISSPGPRGDAPDGSYPLRRFGRHALDDGALPHLPGGVAARLHFVECLLVLEGVHARPESLVAVRDELLQTDEALEGLLDELLALLQVIEDLPLEGEESAVDPEIGTADVADVLDEAIAAERDGVEALAGADT